MCHLKEIDEYIAEQMRDPEFARLYAEQRILTELASAVSVARDKQGLTQGDLAIMAGVAQEQVERIEDGDGCDLETMQKVATVLKLSFPVSGKMTSGCTGK
jgi:ribosome-binding protein aMBF1 (putative translation factor)